MRVSRVHFSSARTTASHTLPSLFGTITICESFIAIPNPPSSQSWNCGIGFFRNLLSLPEAPIVKILGVELYQSFERIDWVAPYIALFVQG